MSIIEKAARKLAKPVRKLVGTTAINERLNSIENAISTRQDIPERAAEITLGGPTSTTRKIVADSFLAGRGIEIGAFAYPLHVPDNATVQYVDKYDVDTLDASHQVAGLTLKDFGVDVATIIKPDIVDDGETLAKIGDYSQDFVIANHVLEHFEDPVKGFKNMLRVLRHGGVIYLSLPEMRHSFDNVRQPTPFEHLLRDYQEGPAWSRAMAYTEFSKIFVAHGMDKGLFPKRSGSDLLEFENQISEELDRANFSIHFHAWTMDGMIEMFSKMKNVFNLAFETRLVLKNNEEVIFIFQKTVPSVRTQ